PFALVKGIRSGSVLGLLYKCVLSNESVINVPKSILRKPARVVSSDVQEGAKPINVEGSGSKVSFEGVTVESLQAVETLQWKNILTVGSSSNSGNPLAFYS
ncbi:hypothetical protein Tco_0131356, partial [Tanacetum coccineum]